MIAMKERSGIEMNIVEAILGNPDLTSLSFKSGEYVEVTFDRKRLSKLGDKNPMWKGDDVGINALHEWINNNRPKPESGLCEFCDIAPLYDADITGIYNSLIMNFNYLSF